MALSTITNFINKIKIFNKPQYCPHCGHSLEPPTKYYGWYCQQCGREYN